MTNTNKSNDNHLRIDVLLLMIVIMSLSLIVAYNGYKEIVSHLYGKYYLSKALRSEIQYTFVPIVILFAGLYIVNAINERRVRLAYLLIIHAFLINLLFSGKDLRIAIVINIAETLFIILTYSLYPFVEFLRKIHVNEGFSKKFSNSTDSFWRSTESETSEIVPSFRSLRIPIKRELLEFLKGFNFAGIKVSYQTSLFPNIRKPRLAFVVALVLLLVCLIKLTTGSEKGAESLSTAVYFLLVVGTGMELYNFLKCCPK